MKRYMLTAILYLVLIPLAQAQIPRTLSYQGVVTDEAGTPLPTGNYNFTFRLYETETGGSPAWEEGQLLLVENSVINAILGRIIPLDLPFDKTYWLGISIAAGDELQPRTRLNASAYSLNASSVTDSAVTSRKIAPNTVVRSLNGATEAVTLTAGNNIAIVRDGNNLTISSTDESGRDSWRLSGNAGTDTTHFLGTTDAQPLELRVNGERAGRFEYTEPDAGPNVILGSQFNQVTDGVYGATISGGGDAGKFFPSLSPNKVTDRLGTVGGGAANTAGFFGMVGGGFTNTASEAHSVVAGGFNNMASGRKSTVSGGSNNVASGDYATVAGGSENRAEGSNSFAAGKSARALHEGSFVWSDLSNNPFISTASNQFLIRATGGVGIGTDAPGSPLTVNGTIESTSGGFKFPDGTTQTTASRSSPWQKAGILQNDIYYNAGNVGIGTSNPTNILTLPNGSATDPIADAWTTYSSRRWKTNIKTIAEPLQKIQRLRGVTYDWKSSGKRDIGLIAEEVGEVIPEVVAYEANGIDARSVDYPRLVALLIEAVKAQQQEIQQLRQQQEAMHKLAAQLDILQQQVARISADASTSPPSLPRTQQTKTE